MFPFPLKHILRSTPNSAKEQKQTKKPHNVYLIYWNGAFEWYSGIQLSSIWRATLRFLFFPPSPVHPWKLYHQHFLVTQEPKFRPPCLKRIKLYAGRTGEIKILIKVTIEERKGHNGKMSEKIKWKILKGWKRYPSERKRTEKNKIQDI